MNANTNTTTRTEAEVGYESSQFALGTGMVVAAFAGLWGAVCLVSALVNIGPLNVVNSYLTAMLG